MISQARIDEILQDVGEASETDTAIIDRLAVGAAELVAAIQRMTPTKDEINALSAAAWELQRRYAHFPHLVSLLRKFAPQDEGLAHLDRLAREHGYKQAGSDERLTEEPNQ